MMVLQYSLVGKSLHWHAITMILFNAKVGIFPLTYAIITSFISCFTTFYCLNPYFSFLHLIFDILVCLAFCYRIQLYTCDCSIRVTAVLGYLESAFHLAGGVSLFHCANITNTARPTITGCVVVIEKIDC